MNAQTPFLPVARVVTDVSLDRIFDYRIPFELREIVKVGSAVRVPFGHSFRHGFVVALAAGSEFKELKEIADVSAPLPLLTGAVLKLVHWMSDYYVAPLEQCVRCVLPAPVRKREKAPRPVKWVELMPDAGSGPSVGPSANTPKVGTARRDFRGRLGDPSLPALGGRLGAVARAVAAKGEQSLPADGGKEPRALSVKQQAIVDYLREHGSQPLARITGELKISVSPLETLQKHGRLQIVDREPSRRPQVRHKVLPTQPLRLNSDQQSALEKIQAEQQASAPCPVLIYGVTGSGKTEVYLQAIATALQQGRGAIVLVPEISLTPQTVERFTARFGERLAVLHSHLSEGERYDEWYRIRKGEADIVVGARSAIFAPVENLGIIIVDEEHEPSYKQEEAPRYNARDMAVMRAKLESCAVVLGSATPSLESWHNAQSGKYRLARLPLRADNRTMPVMRVVDMRIETERTGHVNVFSRDLMEAVSLRLQRGEQTMLFLNRRGYSTAIVCTKCGYVAKCDDCSVSMTYHRSASGAEQKERMRCHICGADKAVPARCPGCNDPAFKFTGIGTQRVERIVNKCFPGAVIARMDADVTTRRGAYDDILGDFRSGKTQILIGTQMIAKGLHFPNVTLVGILFADLSLHMPDFRAGERTFQLLAQVAGRAGRGDVSGEVIIQTFTPHHTAVQAARRLDFEGLADQDLAFRKELGYPPWRHLTCLTFSGEREDAVRLAAETVAKRLQAVLADVLLSDAVPAPLARAKRKYRYQIMLRHTRVASLGRVLRRQQRELSMPQGVQWKTDIDALNIM